jgi:hypothetical protein
MLYQVNVKDMGRKSHSVHEWITKQNTGNKILRNPNNTKTGSELNVSVSFPIFTPLMFLMQRVR